MMMMMMMMMMIQKTSDVNNHGTRQKPSKTMIVVLKSFRTPLAGALDDVSENTLNLLQLMYVCPFGNHGDDGDLSGHRFKVVPLHNLGCLWISHCFEFWWWKVKKTAEALKWKLKCQKHDINLDVGRPQLAKTNKNHPKNPQKPTCCRRQAIAPYQHWKDTFVAPRWWAFTILHPRSPSIQHIATFWLLPQIIDRSEKKGSGWLVLGKDCWPCLTIHPASIQTHWITLVCSYLAVSQEFFSTGYFYHISLAVSGSPGWKTELRHLFISDQSAW